ncbi:kinase-like domain-containing protein [Entophlyctis helioformis]|nr:kinase-like domain-containing protein [Entophlyctis helioformis]
MELCERGNLAAYLDSRSCDGPIGEPEIWGILADVARASLFCGGLQHIHGRGYAHLDIKPGNILIHGSGTLQIADFGMAARAPVSPGADREGDRSYLAPEVLSNAAVTTAVDIFSLGLVLLEVAADIVLPENGPEWERLRTGRLDVVALGLGGRSKPLVDFIGGMVDPMASMRPSASDVLDHPVLSAMLAGGSGGSGGGSGSGMDVAARDPLPGAALMSR